MAEAGTLRWATRATAIGEAAGIVVPILARKRVALLPAWTLPIHASQKRPCGKGGSEELSPSL